MQSVLGNTLKKATTFGCKIWMNIFLNFAEVNFVVCFFDALEHSDLTALNRSLI